GQSYGLVVDYVFPLQQSRTDATAEIVLMMGDRMAPGGPIAVSAEERREERWFATTRYFEDDKITLDLSAKLTNPSAGMTLLAANVAIPFEVASSVLQRFGIAAALLVYAVGSAMQAFAGSQSWEDPSALIKFSGAVLQVSALLGLFVIFGKKTT